MSIFRNLFFIFALLAVSGCSPSTPANVGPTNPAETATPTPVPADLTPTVQPSDTPLPLPTATAFVPFKAIAIVDYVNVRANPGLLFAVNMNVPKNTVFSVLGKTSGNDWINVQTPSNTNGWVYAKLLKGEQDLSSAPVIKPDHVQLITGRVADEKGNLISGINFAVFQGTVRNEVVTGPDGTFYIYMPPTSSGDWVVSYTGIDCSSNLMDAKCNCKAAVCGAVNPPNVHIQVPESKPLDFLWK